ncbi:hypothetical protein J4414_00165 [Candidatus Woesearchaeota archaeon]|nr:hypothetical protein [Candidatus Woesearchaeota archaeon]
MDKSLADFALRHLEKKGVSYVEAKLESQEVNEFLLKNSILESSSFSSNSGLGIRYLFNGTLGFLSTNSSEKEKIKRLINKSLILTNKASKYKEDITLSKERSYKRSYKIKQKIKLADISPEEKLKDLVDADKAILDTKVNTPGRYIALSDKISKKYFINSEGTVINSEIPYVDLHYFLTVNENGKSSQRYWEHGETSGWEAVNGWDIPSIMKDEILTIKNNLEKGKKPPKGILDVVIGPQISGIMVLLKKKSWFRGSDNY